METAVEIQTGTLVRVGGKTYKVEAYVRWDDHLMIRAGEIEQWRPAGQQDAADRRKCRFRFSGDKEWKVGTVIGVIDTIFKEVHWDQKGYPFYKYAVAVDSKSPIAFCNDCEVLERQ